MPSQRTYHVIPGRGLWLVKSAGIKLLGMYAAKEAAVDVAIKAARENQPSQVKVQTLDGRIEARWTYGIESS